MFRLNANIERRQWYAVTFGDWGRTSDGGWLQNIFVEKAFGVYERVEVVVRVGAEPIWVDFSTFLEENSSCFD